jgi:hypothetical protein
MACGKIKQKRRDESRRGRHKCLRHASRTRTL